MTKLFEKKEKILEKPVTGKRKLLAKVYSKKYELECAAAAASTAILMSGGTVGATGDGFGGSTTGFESGFSSLGDVSITTMLGNVVNLVCTIVQFAGAGFTLWGIFSFATAHSNNDPDKQSKATNTIIGGIIAIVAPFVLKALLGIEA